MTRATAERESRARGEPTKPQVFDLLKAFYVSRGFAHTVVDHTKQAKEQDGGKANFFEGNDDLWKAVLKGNVQVANFELAIGDVYYIPPGYDFNEWGDFIVLSLWWISNNLKYPVTVFHYSQNQESTHLPPHRGRR